MFATIRAFIQTLYLLTSNNRARTLVLRPLLKSVVFYFIFLVISISASILYFSIGTGSFQIWAEILGAIISILLLPILACFLYFTFFCEKQFLEIAALTQAESVGGAIKQSPTARSTSKGLSLLIVAMMPVLLITSFFIPPLSFALGGMLFAVDVLSYPLDNRGFSFSAKLQFYISNLPGLFFLGVGFAFGMFIPFGIIICYPIGVLIASFFAENKLNMEAENKK